NLIIKNISDTSSRRLYGTITGIHSPFSIVGGITSFDIADLESDTLPIAFSPTDTGTFRETLTIASNADSAHASYPIMLTGRATLPVSTVPPTMMLSETAIDFGTVRPS